MDNFARYGMTPAPTAQRPLLGLTVLVVEDSRYASEALRLMCLHSGARLRRADSLSAARRHLAIYRPSVALVDMGLPDGSGAELIGELAQMSPRIPTIMGTSADSFAESIAIAAGADAFLLKPHDSLSTFQETILAHLPKDKQFGGPRAISQAEINADLIGFRDDLAHVAELLRRDPTPDVRGYAGQFLAGIAQQAHDETLAMAAHNLVSGKAGEGQLDRVCMLIDDRIEHAPVI